MDLDNVPHNHRSAPRRHGISSFLKCGGNFRAWTELSAAVESNAVVILHGPHGCGKTAGIYDLMTNHLGVLVYEINAGNTTGLDGFVRDITHVTRTKTLLGRRIVLIDDVEGFDGEYIRKIPDLLKKHNKTDDSSIVLTTTNIYDRALLPLRNLDSVKYIRMFSPNCKSAASAARCVTNAPASVIDTLVRQTGGNYHQLLLRLKMQVTSQPDVHVDLFKTTECLLNGNVTADTWSRAAEPDVLTGLLFENCPAIVDSGEPVDALDRMMSFTEVFSETHRFGTDYRLVAVAAAAREYLRTEAPPVMRLSRAATLATPSLHLSRP